jgi:6,7-dimethyl-8-ribityllumazine synthase
VLSFAVKHFEIVSNESASAISRISLETGIPVANGVLTTETDEQAEVRAADKGRDCAQCAVEMANLVAALEPEADEDDEDEDLEQSDARR